MSKKIKSPDRPNLPPDDITVQLVCNYQAAKDPELRALHLRAAKEILKLRKALRPFANWSNHISIADIFKAKEILSEEAKVEELERHLNGVIKFTQET